MKARALPVAGAFEKGFWGGGYVMKITHQSSDALKVNITVGGSVNALESATIGQGQTYEVKDLYAGSTSSYQARGTTGPFVAFFPEEGA